MVKNIILASVLTVVCAFSANAQDETRRIAAANSIDSVKLEYHEALGGLRHDELVMVLPDGSVAWKGQTIEGFHGTAKIGGAYDFGQGSGAVFGYNFGVVFGYAGRVMDWDVSASYAQISDASGKAYGAFNCFFEPAISVAKWGKNNLQTNKFYVGAKIGLQEARNDSQFSYEDDNIIVNGTSVPTSMGLAYGLKIGYERRHFMSPVRWGIELSAHTYDVKHEFKVNGATVNNSTDRRFFVGCTFYIKGVLQKKAKNY